MSSKLKVLVSNPGMGSHVRQTLKAYSTFGLLYKFYTTIYLKNNKVNISLTNSYKSLKSRQFSELDNKKVKSLFVPELLRLFSARFFSNAITDRIWEWSELFFDRWVASYLTNKIDVVHGYEHACLATFNKAKEKRILKVYEQPSAHHLYTQEKVINVLLNTEKDFKDNFVDIYDSELSRKRNARRDEETKQADVIVCNSSYVQKTLIHAGVEQSKIKVVPLGFPQVKKHKLTTNSKIKFIVSGNLSYLKGTHQVLRVWRDYAEEFAEHELICIGSDSLNPKEWEHLPSNVTKLNRLSHEEYLVLMSTADVLILNTFSDGFGMVITEAMANGLAVIATEHSAAPDLIEHNISGKIIPINNSNELLNAMLDMINNPNNLLNMKEQARKKAESYSWELYRKKLVEVVESSYYKWRSND